MTASEIIQRVRLRLDEDLGDSSQRYPTATLTEYIEDGVRFYVARVGNQYATTTVTQVANRLLYDLPCDCVNVVRVTWDNDGEYVPLAATSPRELDGEWYQWQRQTDVRSRCYFVFGLDQIALWPESADGGETYTIHYRQDDEDGDVASVPAEDHEALVCYVVARCLLVERKADGAREYAKWRKTVEDAAQRRASMDRVVTR